MGADVMPREDFVPSFEEDDNDNLPVVGYKDDRLPVTKRDRDNAMAWSIIEENMSPFLVHFTESVKESGFQVSYEETDQGYEITIDSFILTIRVERAIND